MKTTIGYLATMALDEDGQLAELTVMQTGRVVLTRQVGGGWALAVEGPDERVFEVELSAGTDVAAVLLHDGLAVAEYDER